mmetsp:Transcript_16699/g.15997  ORF Transcript_16699/g.15997 Transcript_16699/m.15997 type:complete len:153 (-) Transcript_16699:37-495(-)
MGEFEGKKLVKDYTGRGSMHPHLAPSEWKPGFRKNSHQGVSEKEELQEVRNRNYKNHSMNKIEEEDKRGKETLPEILKNQTKEAYGPGPGVKRNNLREFKKEYEQPRFKANDKNSIQKYQSQTISPFRTSKKPPLARQMLGETKKGSMPLAQ